MRASGIALSFMLEHAASSHTSFRLLKRCAHVSGVGGRTAESETRNRNLRASCTRNAVSCVCFQGVRERTWHMSILNGYSTATQRLLNGSLLNGYSTATQRLPPVNAPPRPSLSLSFRALLAVPTEHATPRNQITKAHFPYLLYQECGFLSFDFAV
eukprot:2061104-Rhodomonas_salina.1